MEKRRLIIPLLLLIVVFLNAQTAYASTYEVKLEEKSPGHFCFDGRDYDDYDFTVYHRFTVKKPARLYLYGDSYFRRNSYWEKDMHGNFSLYNSNKKRLFNISDYSEF